MEKTYALSIRQPWAELIINGRKKMELRSWSTTYHGLLWIHAGRKENPELEQAYGLTNLFKGGYIGSARLGKVIPLDHEEWEHYRSYHLDLGDYQAGYYGWFIDSPQRFRAPILAPGSLGLYYPDSEITELLEKSISASG
jgi:hypothetical protein